MGDYRILVTGTRENSPEIRDLVWQTLDSASFWAAQHHRIIVVHGQCPVGGVDKDADDWATARGHQAERHPARRVGRRFLGPERNTEMVAAGADVCIGFPGPGSRGTWDCLRKAVDAGIPTSVVPVGGRAGEEVAT